MSHNRDLSAAAAQIGVNNSNIGIGTDNPGHILDLYNSDGTDCLKLNVNGGAGGSSKQNAIRFSVDGDVKAHMGLAVDAGRLISGSIANDFCIKGLGSNNILFATNSSEKVRITTGGNIGIGDANPSNKLTVKSGNGDQLRLDNAGERYTQISLRNNGTQKAAIWLDETNDDLSLYAAVNYDMRFLTNGTESARITSDGKMGVGTVSPNHRLTLHQSGTSTFDALNITSGLTNAVGLQLGINSASNAFFWHTANGGIQFATNNVERMRVTNNGITFNGDTAAANALDDYEEGSWNPQILGWNGSYSIQEGRYIKIGRMVHVIGEVKSDANAGNSFTNSWPGLSNLPFANTTSFQGVSGSQRCMGYATILGSISPGGTNGQGFVTFDRNTGNNAFFPNHISSQGAQNFSNSMINNPTTVDFGYRFNCTFYTD